MEDLGRNQVSSMGIRHLKRARLEEIFHVCEELIEVSVPKGCWWATHRKVKVSWAA